jgi:RNAse (barnase) inhibitor barstar
VDLRLLVALISRNWEYYEILLRLNRRAEFLGDFFGEFHQRCRHLGPIGLSIAPKRCRVALFQRRDFAGRLPVAKEKKHDYKVRGLDAAYWRSEDVFHADVKRVLSFPDYYGNNMNAFNDCLSELDINADGGYVIALLHFDRFFVALPDRAKAVLDMIEANSRRFLITGQRLLALVQTDDPRTTYEHIGCIAPSWNPRERLDRNRGL